MLAKPTAISWWESNSASLHQTQSASDEFKLRVFQVLTEELVNLSPESSEESSEASGSRDTRQLELNHEPISEEVAEVFAAFSDVLAGRGHPGTLDADRLELFGLSISRDRDAIPTHLANRMFVRRNEITLSGMEVRAWFRTYLSDLGRSSRAADRVIPFPSALGSVTLLTDLAEDSAESLIMTEEHRIGEGWLRLATALQLRPQAIWPATPLDHIRTEEFRDMWTRVVVATGKEVVVKYWLSVKRSRDVRLARLLKTSPDENLASLGSVLVGLLGTKPDATALAQSMPRLLVDGRVTQVFSNNNPFATVPVPELENLVLRSYIDFGVRLRALDELIEQDAVPGAVVQSMFKKGDIAPFSSDRWTEVARERLFDREVSAAFLERLLEISTGLPKELKPQVSMALARLAAHNGFIAHAAASLFEWDKYMDDQTAALLLRRHEGTQGAFSVAEALASGTYGQANEYIDLMKQAGADDTTLTFLRRQYEAIALRYLSKLPDARSHKHHVRRIRELASGDGPLRYEALSYLVDVHEDEDIDLLLARSKYTDETTGQRMAGVITKRASLKRLRELVGADNELMAVAALVELQARQRLPSKAKLKALLRSESAAIRMSALSIVTVGMSVDELTGLLDAYTGGSGTYYYNVVCELDRMISGLVRMSYSLDGR